MLKVNSKAALKRLPVGTKLRLVGKWGLRPEEQIKVVHIVTSNAIALMNSDGRISWLGLDAIDGTPIRIIGTERGFRVACAARGEVTGSIIDLLEYEFIDEEGSKA